MRFATYAGIRRGACRARLESLVETLHEYDCVARIERERRRIALDIPEDGFEWIVTGGLAELLASFEDCLVWERRFYQTSGSARPRLPAPGPRTSA